MYREVTMYRIECDAEGCDESPQSDEYFAWLQKDGADDDLANASGWWTGERDGEVRHLCEEHRPRCTAEDCEQSLNDDEWGDFCEDHAPEDALHGTVARAGSDG